METTATSRGEAVALLARLRMFAGAPRAQLAALAARARTLRAAAGEVVAEAGKRLPGLMVLRYGLVKLSLRGDGEKVLRLVGPGESFGEPALFLEQTLSVHATALADTALLVVPAPALLQLFDDDRRFARALVATLCGRLHAVVADFESATVHGARERLAAYLESLASFDGPGAVAHLPATKTVIAAHLGISKETLSRLLRAFREAGLIAVLDRHIALLDRARLATLARGKAAGRAA